MFLSGPETSIDQSGQAAFLPAYPLMSIALSLPGQLVFAIAGMTQDSRSSSSQVAIRRNSITPSIEIVGVFYQTFNAMRV
jgi:hypothetical protein